MPVARPASMSRSASPTYMHCTGGVFSPAAACSIGLGSGLATPTVSPLTTTAGAMGKPSRGTSLSVKRIGLLVTIPQA